MNFGRASTRRRPDLDINVTGLVDIIFQLLLFFILTSSFRQSSGIDVQLPSASASDVEPTAADLTLTVTAGGRVMMGDLDVELSALAEALTTRREAEPRLKVVLIADATVPHGMVVQVMDAIRTAGILDLAVATDAP